MASTFTASLLLEKIADTEQEDTWGGTERDTLDGIDDAIAGELALSVAGASDVTLTDAQMLHAYHDLTGALTGNINYIVPARPKFYVVENATSGAFTLTVKTPAGSGIAPTQGETNILYCDGTNVKLVYASGSSALNNVVEDTSPQLGGHLDVNDFGLLDANGNEQLGFSKVASAVNYADALNAATGVGPSLRALGDDTNVDLNLVGKGTGTVNLGNAALKFPNSDGSAGDVLTTDGAGVLSLASGAFASGTKMLFEQSTAPTGWTKQTAAGYSNAALRIVTGTIGQGGSDVFSTVFGSSVTTAGHSLTVAELAAHTHTTPGRVTEGSPGSTALQQANNSGTLTHIAGGSTGSGTAHSHDLTLDLKYRDIIICAKD